MVLGSYPSSSPISVCKQLSEYPHLEDLPCAKTSQRSANLCSGEGFLFLGCSNLANQKDSTVSKSSHTSEPQALQFKSYLEMHFNQTTKHTRVSHPPINCTVTCPLQVGLFSLSIRQENGQKPGKRAFFIASQFHI